MKHTLGLDADLRLQALEIQHLSLTVKHMVEIDRAVVGSALRKIATPQRAKRVTDIVLQLHGRALQKSLALKRGSVKGDPSHTRNSFIIPGHPVANTIKGWNLYILWDW